MPTGKPTARAASDRLASSPWRCTSATDRPASGPNSGPTTMAPTIRIGWSNRIPTDAICIAITMNATKLNDSSVSSLVRCWTSSHTTASEGRPGAARSAATAASDIAVSTCSTAIDPTRGISSSLRSLMITLASSRVMSHRITSPSGFMEAPCRWTTLITEGAAQSSSSAWWATSCGATMRRWIMRRPRSGPARCAPRRACRASGSSRGPRTRVAARPRPASPRPPPAPRSARWTSRCSPGA